MAEHTKGEWTVKADYNVVSDRRVVATCATLTSSHDVDGLIDAENRANAEFICCAVNSHDELVENLVRLCDDFKEFIDYHIPGAHPDYQLANESINVARAAIAKATGDSSPTSVKE